MNRVTSQHSLFNKGLFTLTFYSSQLIIIKMKSEIMIDNKGMQYLAQFLIMMFQSKFFQSTKVNKTNQIKA